MSLNAVIKMPFIICQLGNVAWNKKLKVLYVYKIRK